MEVPYSMSGMVIMKAMSSRNVRSSSGVTSILSNVSA